MNLIDTITAELADRGWSVGDAAYREAVITVWQVYGHWRSEKVLSRAPDQTTAWRLAAEQIVELRRLAFCERMMAIEQSLSESPLDKDRERLLEETDRLEYEFGRDYIFARDALA
jgi:hypothetical protein